jgi:phosphatidate cytidylyltransferase
VVPPGEAGLEPGRESPEPEAPEDGLGGWWATGVALDDTPSRSTDSLPAEEAEAIEEDAEAEAGAPLFPWWEAAAPSAPPAAPPATPPLVEALEVAAPPAEERRGAGAASLVPLDLPAPTREPEPLDRGLWEGPAVIPVISAEPGLPEPAAAEPGLVELLPEPGAGGEAADFGLWEAPAAIPLISAEPGEAGWEPIDLPAVPEERAALEPEESAAAVAEELARATAALLAEIGEEPAVIEPLEAGPAESADEGLEALRWTSSGPAAETAVPERDAAEGAAPLESLDEGGGGLVLPAWEPSAAEGAAGGIPAGRQPVEPPVAVPEELIPESEVDEWVAFVEGLPSGTTAARRAAGAAAVPPTSEAAEPPGDWEIGGAPAPRPAVSRRRGWFRRRRRGDGEEWPEQAWAAGAGEAAPEPPPWAAGTAPVEALPQGDLSADETPLLDDAAEAEAAWAAWEAGAEGAAGEAEPKPTTDALPPAEAPGGVPAARMPLPGRGEPAVDEDETPWEGAEWAGEPGATAGDLYAEVDEDEVEVPPAGLPEEEWEADDELPPLAGRYEPEPDLQPEEDLEAAGWEAFPEPGEPLAYRYGEVAPPEAVPERTATPAAAGSEALEGWETFPEPGTRAPGWSAGGAAWGPRPVPGPEPVFPEGDEGGEAEDEAAWGAGPGVGSGPLGTAGRWPGSVGTGLAAEEQAGDEAGHEAGYEAEYEEDEAAWAAEPGAGFGYPAGPVRAAGAADQPTMEMPAPVFDFEGSPRFQRPISEEILAGAVTMEHRGLAEEVAAADTAETELQALSAPMPGLESGVVGFEDVAHLGSDEEMTAPARSDLPIRVATGMVLALMLLGALWVGGEFFAGFVGLMAILGLGEFYGSLRRCGYQPLALFGFLGAAGMLAGTWFYGPVSIPIATVATVILSFFYYAFAPHRRDALTNGGLALLGMLWVIGTAAFAFPIAASPEFRVLVLATAATVIATDVGAYFAGRSWGRRLMAPVLSPHKTWEGLAGGVVLGIGAAVGAGYLFDEIGLRAGAALGLVVAVMAPLGDLAESMVKRSLGVKDMGSMLPGHGGILDRIDAFLFVLPAAWVLFETMGLLR